MAYGDYVQYTSGARKFLLRYSDLYCIYYDCVVSYTYKEQSKPRKEDAAVQIKKYNSYGERPVFGVLSRENRLIGEIPLHGHDHYEIEYVADGTMVNTINGKETVMSPGDFYILSPDDLHRLDAVTGQVKLFSLCLYLPELNDEFADFLISHKTPVTGTLPEEDRPLFEALIHRMTAQTADAFGFASDILHSGARLAIALLYRCEPQLCAGEGAADDAIVAALRYISAAYREPITLEDTARRVGLSPNYFCTLFRQRTGCSFVNYLTILRVRKAQMLLASGTEKSITQVAYEVGFGSYTNFYRAFLRVLGTPPHQFRFREDAKPLKIKKPSRTV